MKAVLSERSIPEILLLLQEKARILDWLLEKRPVQLRPNKANLLLVVLADGSKYYTVKQG